LTDTQDLPYIISVDDHVIEPPGVWADRLPASLRDRGPQLTRRRGIFEFPAPGRILFADDDGEKARWCDIWQYEDLAWPLPAAHAQVRLREHLDPYDPVTLDDIYPGCYEPAARIADMQANHVEASLNFPTFPRFCGQTFLERQDKDLALLCVQAYNDWMIEEWCGGDSRGRLIPLTLIPLWDAELAATEVHRCAGKGSGAIAFSENPAKLGLPSIHSGRWDPLFRACEETETVVNMHIGSSSAMTRTSDDAPLSVQMALTSLNATAALADWILGGVLARFPRLRMALSEGQVGWMPFELERLDAIWAKADVWEPAMRERLPFPPSYYMQQVYGCIFDDLHGLECRSIVGMDQIMFETDYPHADSTFPDSRETAAKLIEAASLNQDETWQLLRGNAIRCYGLDRFGLSE
jgi:predicted TIM-barrel fold metal-dependent hydrolase